MHGYTDALETSASAYGLQTVNFYVHVGHGIRKELYITGLGGGEVGGDSRMDKEATGHGNARDKLRGLLTPGRKKKKHCTIRCQIFISKNKNCNQTFINSLTVSENVHFFITMYNIKQN